MWCLQLCDQDPEYVEEEAEVGQNAEQSWGHVDPLNPLLGLGRKRPTQLVVNVDAEEAIHQARDQRKACKATTDHLWGCTRINSSCLGYVSTQIIVAIITAHNNKTFQ